MCLCFRRANLSKHEHSGEDSAGSCHPRDHKQLELDLVCLIDFFNQKELQCCSSLDENLKPIRQTKQADTSTGQRSKIFILDKIKCGVFSLVSFLISHYLGDNCVLLVWPVGPY